MFSLQATSQTLSGFCVFRGLEFLFLFFFNGSSSHPHAKVSEDGNHSLASGPSLHCYKSAFLLSLVTCEVLYVLVLRLQTLEPLPFPYLGSSLDSSPPLTSSECCRGEVRESGITFASLHPLTHLTEYYYPLDLSSASKITLLTSFHASRLTQSIVSYLMTHRLLAGQFLKGINHPIYLMMDISRSKCDRGHIAPYFYLLLQLISDSRMRRKLLGWPTVPCVIWPEGLAVLPIHPQLLMPLPQSQLCSCVGHTQECS